MNCGARDLTLRRRIRLLTWLVILGLVLSGATAIPLVSEVGWLVKITGANALIAEFGNVNAPSWALWLTQIDSALRETISISGSTRRPDIRLPHTV